MATTDIKMNALQTQLAVNPKLSSAKTEKVTLLALGALTTLGLVTGVVALGITGKSFIALTALVGIGAAFAANPVIGGLFCGAIVLTLAAVAVLALIRKQYDKTEDKIQGLEGQMKGAEEAIVTVEQAKQEEVQKTAATHLAELEAKAAQLDMLKAQAEVEKQEVKAQAEAEKQQKLEDAAAKWEALEALEAEKIAKQEEAAKQAATEKLEALEALEAEKVAKKEAAAKQEADQVKEDAEAFRAFMAQQKALEATQAEAQQAQEIFHRGAGVGVNTEGRSYEFEYSEQQ